MKLITNGPLLFIIGAFCTAIGILLIEFGNPLGYAAICLVVLNTAMFAQANHWPLRLRISHLKWRLAQLGYTIERTRVEIEEAWIDQPGSQEWHVLTHWVQDLHIERAQLRERIEDLVHKLERETY